MVFITWSGDVSKQVAIILQDWIPKVIQAAKETFMSDKSIRAGKRWFPEISEKLQNSKFGIVCLTRANLNEPWIHFEAGALAKVITESRVVPYLYNLEPSDIPAGPLSHFQAKKCNKDETFDLMCSLNEALGENGLTERHLKESFEQWWPQLETKLDQITSEKKKEPVRKTDDMVREILETVKGISRSLSETSDLYPFIKLENLLRSGFTSTHPWEKGELAKRIAQPKGVLESYFANKEKGKIFEEIRQIVDSWKPPESTSIGKDDTKTEPDKKCF